MPKWDKENRPIGYILGVSPGFSQFEQGENRLTFMGLAKKITKAARLGFEFAMIDFESLSEMFEPDIKQQVEHIKRAQNIEVGLHLPYRMDLCLADAYIWSTMQEQLKLGTIAAADIMKAKFMLFHTSSNPRPNLTPVSGQRQYPSKMASWNGMNFGDWIVKESEGSFNFKQWFMAKFIRVMFSAMGSPPDVDVVKYFDNIENFQKEMDRINGIFEEAENKIKEELKKLAEDSDRLEKDASNKEKELGELELKRSRKGLTSEENKKRENLIKELTELRRTKAAKDRRYSRIINNSSEFIKEKIIEKYGKSEYNKIYPIYRRITLYQLDIPSVFEYWREHGSEAEEYVVYHATAKWMWKNKDPLYTSIVTDQRDPDKIISEANTKMGQTGSLDESIKEIITAVAAKYIEGHLKASGPEYGIPAGEKKFVSPYEYAKKNKVHIFIETNMPSEGAEGKLRIIRATDHIKIAKVLDPEHISYCLDTEHLTTNFISPEEEAEKIMKTMPGDGKYIRCLHVNAPRPIPGAHAPIALLSNDMYILYRTIYKLREAGMKNTYIIWEMGSYGVKQSAIAYRKIIDALEKNIAPEDLPPEFFGINKNFEAAQNIAIREHAFDPLQGLLAVPEETHGFLSRAAVEKGKGAEWKKEELK